MAAGLADVGRVPQLIFDVQDYVTCVAWGQFSDELLRWLGRSAFHRRCLGRAGRNSDFSERTCGPADRANHRGPASSRRLCWNQIHPKACSRARRVVAAARGRPVVDFGARRSRAPTRLARSRAPVISAGAAGTSNLLAARQYKILTPTPWRTVLLRSSTVRWPLSVRPPTQPPCCFDTTTRYAGVDHFTELAKRGYNRRCARSGWRPDERPAICARLDTAPVLLRSRPSRRRPRRNRIVSAFGCPLSDRRLRRGHPAHRGSRRARAGHMAYSRRGRPFSSGR